MAHVGVQGVRIYKESRSMAGWPCFNGSKGEYYSFEEATGNYTEGLIYPLKTAKLA
jgi:hypothetical protein